jgi:ATP adenylyltransferase
MTTLLEKIRSQSTYALSCGSLEPIDTNYQILTQESIPFIIRTIPNLARKEQAKKKKKADKSFNPFLPYEEDLFVGELSPTHICLLNKYNVIDNHVLLVTREYEEQDNWLNLADFQAMWTCLAQIDGLGFYNGGKIAGSSQPHKHLQLAPFPWVEEVKQTPLDVAISLAHLPPKQICHLPPFDFQHALITFDFELGEAQTALGYYYQLLDKLELIDVKPEAIQQTAPYNLLITRRWMLIVPRTLEKYQSISVNSLGFAGALLVRHLEQLKDLKASTPLKILQSIALPQPQ